MNLESRLFRACTGFTPSPSPAPRLLNPGVMCIALKRLVARGGGGLQSASEATNLRMHEREEHTQPSVQRCGVGRGELRDEGEEPEGDGHESKGGPKRAIAGRHEAEGRWQRQSSPTSSTRQGVATTLRKSEHPSGNSRPDLEGLLKMGDKLCERDNQGTCQPFCSQIHHETF